MARDKLITIRIEGDKRQAFGDLAKSQNTDTASLLYDFISGCLDGRIDIRIVTVKGNRIDNQLDTDRIDKLETATQEIDNRLDTIAKKLTDWVEAFDSRLNDCDQGLSEKIISLEHRLNALAIQLDSQQIDRIDTDSQQDRQGENPDMGTVATVETVYTVETAIESVEAVTDTVEAVTDTVESDSTIEPVQPAIGPVGMTAMDAAKYLKAKKIKVSGDSLYRWIRQEKITDSPQGKKVQKYLTLITKLYYPIY